MAYQKRDIKSILVLLAILVVPNTKAYYRSISIETADPSGFFEALSLAFSKIYGQPRTEASLGTINDLPMELKEGAEKYTPNIENPLLLDQNNVERKDRSMQGRKKSSYRKRVQQVPNGFSFRDHKKKLGCGVPVCTIIDMKVKSFRSLCDLAAYMNENGMHRRVMEVQKGSCENSSI